VLGQVLAAAALADAGAGSERLEGLLAGEEVGAAASAPVALTPSDGGWSATGRTEPVPFAPSATSVVLPGRTADGEQRLVLVEWSPGRSSTEPAMDRTREVGWIQLDGELATDLGGADVVQAHLDRGAVLYAAELLGCAQRVLDLSVAYAQDRVQFGRPIGSFQAVKHRCADMLVDVEGMRSAVWWAAWCLSADDPDRSLAASTAKAWCSDAGMRVMSSGLQVHGGIGFTWEHDLHLFLKRAHLDQVCFGDAPAHRARLAALLRQRVLEDQPLV
jgi:alkylation response protein AidB-like acyl-CoA dehydrogenase